FMRREPRTRLSSPPSPPHQPRAPQTGIAMGRRREELGGDSQRDEMAHIAGAARRGPGSHSRARFVSRRPAGRVPTCDFLGRERAMTKTARVASPVDFVSYGDYSVKVPMSADGSFVRPLYPFQGRITADGSSGFRAQAGRYHLYVSLACPWAHRSVIVRGLMDLEDVVSLSVVDPVRDGRGWAFREGRGYGPDPV